jgi:hypothetical protein
MPRRNGRYRWGFRERENDILAAYHRLLQPDQGRVLVAEQESEGSPLQDLATLDKRQVID